MNDSDSVCLTAFELADLLSQAYQAGASGTILRLAQEELRIANKLPRDLHRVAEHLWGDMVNEEEFIEKLASLVVQEGWEAAHARKVEHARMLLKEMPEHTRARVARNKH